MYQVGQVIKIKGHNLVREIISVRGNKIRYKGMFGEGTCNISDVECTVTECKECGYPKGKTLKCLCNK